MKTIPKPAQKYLKYLVFLGLSLAIAGLIAGIVSEKWSALPISLLVTGSLLALVGLVFYVPQLQVFLQQHSTQVGTDAIVATLSVVIILGLINFLALRYPARLDLTETQLFTLYPQTKEIVANLPKPLKVWVFDTTPDPADKELLNDYRRQGNNLQYEFVDPQIKLSLVKKFGVESPKEVHLEYDERQQRLPLSEPGNLSEPALTNGIERILRQEQPQIYFLEGHGELSLEQTGENSLSRAQTSLEELGYRVESLNLAERGEMPEETAAIVIAAPQREFLEREVRVLQDYLEEGGSLLLMFEPGAKSGLDPLLKEWGIRLDSRLVIDGSLASLSPATILVKDYGLHPITADFENGNSVYPLAEPIEVKGVKGIEAIPLLITSEQSWGESNLEAETLEFNPESDRPGPLTIGYALSREKAEDLKKEENPDASDSEDSATQQGRTEVPVPEETNLNEEESPDASKPDKKVDEARLVVFGNVRFASNGWFDQQLNGDVFLNSVKWLANTDETPLSIRPKELKNRSLTLVIGKIPIVGIIAWLAVFIVPVAGLAIAGFTWWRRR